KSQQVAYAKKIEQLFHRWNYGRNHSMVPLGMAVIETVKSRPRLFALAKLKLTFGAARSSG
ncbi:MAG: hypothetical protein WCB71_16635, partial [Aestuariivirga sp.]